MKRFLATILALVYLTVSSGMVMNMHYCMGKLSSVKLAVMPLKKCGCGKMEQRGCCKTESKLVKLDDTQKIAYADIAIQGPLAVPVLPVSIFQLPYISAQLAVSPQAHAPPPLLSEQDTYLRNCVFRI